MDLFEKEEKGKEILDGGKRVVLTFKSNGKYNVEVTHGAIKVTQKGALNMVNRGLVGTKTFSINRLSGIQLKDPGITTGYLQFILIGSGEGKGGVFNAVKDENTITFGKKEKNLARELKEYVDHMIENPQSQSVHSELDDLHKLKALLDEGVITEEEFKTKKKQILGL